MENTILSYSCTRLIANKYHEREQFYRPCVCMTTLNLIVLGTAQDRLRMVGGLQSLVKTLRDIALQANSSQQECDGNVAQVFELALHIVKTLSAAAFGHCKMCL